MPTLPITIFPIIILVIGIASGNRTCLGTSSIQFFDMDDSFCCNGVVHNRVDNGENRDCCSIEHVPLAQGTIYNTNSKLCCGGHVLDRLQKGKMTTLKCCGIDYLKNESNGCCNGVEYDPSVNYCCYNQVVKGSFCCRNAAGVTIITNKPESNQKCCGTRLHNTTTEICLKEQVRPNTDAMCGQDQIIYDTNTHICCHDTGELLLVPQKSYKKFVPKPNYQCINGKVVDVDENVPCEDGTFIDQNDNATTLFCCHGNYTKILSNFTKLLQCCGKDIIETKYHSCCNGQEINLLQICCGGRIYSDMAALCCNGQIVEKATHICCALYSNGNEQLIHKTQANHTSCCGSTSSKLRSYNHHDQCCHKGQLYGKEFCEALTVRTISLPPQHTGSPPIDTQVNLSKRLHASLCPLCEDSFKQRPCEKRFRIQAFIHNINITGTHTYVSAVITHPGSHDMRKVTLIVPYQCTCWKTNLIYVIYTNRPKFHLTKAQKLQFTSKDRIVKLKSSMSIGCQINTVLKSRYRSYVSSSLWQ